MLLSAALIAAGLAVAAPMAANAADPTSISLSATEVSTNGSFTVTATGFAADEALTLSLDSTDMNSDAVADADGAAELYGYVSPKTTLGVHEVTVTGVTTGPVSAELTVVAGPTLTLSASTVTLSQLNGAGLTATAKGFEPGETVAFGAGTGNSGGPLGEPVTADEDGVATIAVTSQSLFGGPVTEARTLYISASNADNSFSTGSATLEIVADAATATPAVPVKAAASFTG